jgi:hypothetical protein
LEATVLRLGKILILVLAATSVSALAEEDIGLGPWRLGMTKDLVVAQKDFGPYTEVRVTGGVETGNARFAGHPVNTSFVFNDAGLEFLQVWNYEGEEWRKAQSAALEVFDYFSEKFGGATIPGVEVNGGSTIDRSSLAVVLERVLSTAEGLESKAQKDENTLTITFDMIPLKQPAASRLHCQWVYVGRANTFYVFLFQDRPEAPSRRATSAVHVDRL